MEIELGSSELKAEAETDDSERFGLGSKELVVDAEVTTLLNPEVTTLLSPKDSVLIDAPEDASVVAEPEATDSEGPLWLDIESMLPADEVSRVPEKAPDGLDGRPEVEVIRDSSWRLLVLIPETTEIETDLLIGTVANSVLIEDEAPAFDSESALVTEAVKTPELERISEENPPAYGDDRAGTELDSTPEAVEIGVMDCVAATTLGRLFNEDPESTLVGSDEPVEEETEDMPLLDGKGEALGTSEPTGVDSTEILAADEPKVGDVVADVPEIVREMEEGCRDSDGVLADCVFVTDPDTTPIEGRFDELDAVLNTSEVSVDEAAEVWTTTEDPKATLEAPVVVADEIEAMPVLVSENMLALEDGNKVPTDERLLGRPVSVGLVGVGFVMLSFALNDADKELAATIDMEDADETLLVDSTDIVSDEEKALVVDSKCMLEIGGVDESAPDTDMGMEGDNPDAVAGRLIDRFVKPEGGDEEFILDPADPGRMLVVKEKAPVFA